MIPKELLNMFDYHAETENIEFAKGKNKLPEGRKEIFKQIKRAILCKLKF